MNLAQVQPIVESVLYEGYILYPYRPSSTKNQQRWSFGGVYPKTYFEHTGGADPCHMQAQTLLQGDENTNLEVLVRFLQPSQRQVGKLHAPLTTWSDHGIPEYEPVAELKLGKKQFHTWQEAIERDVAVADCRLAELLKQARRFEFVFDSKNEYEPLIDESDGQIKGLLLHRKVNVQGFVEVSAEQISDGTYRIAVRVENHTPMDPATIANRDEASLYSFASTHAILDVKDGGFYSLIDPPEHLKDAAAACQNQGVFPIMVGETGATDMILCSPITLYDYPEIAPQSHGDYYDGLEYDEILSLNILAMTDDEKREMAATDPRGAALLERTQALTGDDFLRLHGICSDVAADAPEAPTPQTNPFFANRKGTIDPPDSNPLEPQNPPSEIKQAFTRSDGVEFKIGDRVHLRPHSGGDVMDLALAGMDAAIEAIDSDFEDRIHIAVTLDDDPGREWGLQRMPGHRFFFSPEEIEPIITSNKRAQAQA